MRDMLVLVGEVSREDYDSIERAGLGLRARGWRKAFSLNEMLEAYELLVSRHLRNTVGHGNLASR